jgi:peptidoglycan/LPS O-acetylase OafA/YrhL
MAGIDEPSPPALKQVPPGLTLDGLADPKLAMVKAAYLSWVFVEAAVVGVLRLTGPGPGGRAALMAAGFAATLAAGWCAWRWVEVPAHRWILVRATRQPPAAIAAAQPSSARTSG